MIIIVVIFGILLVAIVLICYFVIRKQDKSIKKDEKKAENNYKIATIPTEKTLTQKGTNSSELTIQRPLFNLIAPLSKDEIRVSYVTDIHLLDRFAVNGCQSKNDELAHKVLSKIFNVFYRDKKEITIIGGDITHDFDLYKEFIRGLADCDSKKFVTLGNHELWPFEGSSLDEIVKTYKAVLQRYNIRLIHNNIFYFTGAGIREINTEDLIAISGNALRNRLIGAYLIIFGGMGFAGKNLKFNADFGLYRGTIDREEEIKQSKLFNELYEKVRDNLFDKNVIIVSHMPLIDWAEDKKHAKGFIYISGHNHHNYYFDDGNTRIYSDNQIGYSQKNVNLKFLLTKFCYDWFALYGDGIFNIKKEDYEKFYRGVGDSITFNIDYEALYMIKREGYYMFLIRNYRGNLQLLNGGKVINIENRPLEYYYDNLKRYADAVNSFLSKYSKYQKDISTFVKSIGGNGRIHGCIIDIDFYNHLYINPLDGKITPYYALNVAKKYVYENIPSLIKYRCEYLIPNYNKVISTQDEKNYLTIIGKNSIIKDTFEFVSSTEIYKISNVIYKLQKCTEHNIICTWNDIVLKMDALEGEKILINDIVAPVLTNNKVINKPNIHVNAKNIEEERKRKINVYRNERMIKPHTSEEEKRLTREKTYRNKINKINDNIEVIYYKDASSKVKYRCKSCGTIFEMRPDHFKDRCDYKCPRCRRK